jgi:fructose-1,6-bisphosphatase/inositol monophosphatase family enzyme
VGGRLLGVVSSCGFRCSVDWGIWVLIVHGRDIAAGAAILLEAGGLMTTANPPADVDTAPIEDVRLGSRLYLAIR